MSCEKCEGLGWDHNEVKQRMKDSLFWCGFLLCGFDQLSKTLHLPLCDWFQQKLQDERLYFLIMLPRGHFKTTLFSQAYMVWRLINNPELRLLFTMSSTREAQKKLEVVKGIIRSEMFGHFFPELVPEISRVRWSATEMEIVRSSNWDAASITAMGVDSRKVGGHYDEHIFDDLVDEKAPESEERIQNAIRFLGRSNPLFVDRRIGRRLVIGTLWPGGFYEPLMEDDGYERLILGCRADDRYERWLAEMGYEPYVERGTPIFPERETEETLERCLKDMGPRDFSHQMDNVLIEEGMQPFKESDCLQYTKGIDNSVAVDSVEYPVSAMYITVSVDPSVSESKGSDESGITVCGYMRNVGLAFVLEAWAGRVLQYDLAHKVLDLAEKWGADTIIIEDVAYQKTFKQYLREKMLERNCHFSITPIHPGPKSKAARILNALQPFIRNHQVFFGPDEGNRKLIYELSRVQYVNEKAVIAGRSPNLADSLAYHVGFWRKTPKVKPSDDIPWFSVGSQQPKARSPFYGLRCTM